MSAEIQPASLSRPVTVMQSASNSSSCEYTEVDSDGDAVFHVGRGENSITIRIASVKIRLLSPVFADMFQPYHAPGNLQRFLSDQHFSLPNDSPKAFAAFCNACSRRQSDFVKSPADFVDFAIVCQKYKCAGETGPFKTLSMGWYHTFLQGLKADKVEEAEWIRLLYTSYVFEDHDIFRIAMWFSMRYNTSKSFDATIPLPPNLLRRLKRMRERSLVAAYNRISKIIETALESAHTENDVRTPSCLGQSVLSRYMRHMRKLKLYPPPSTVHLQNTALVKFHKSLRSMKAPDWPANDPSRACYCYVCNASWQRQLWKTQQELVGSVRTPCLPCTKPGTRTVKPCTCDAKGPQDPSSNYPEISHTFH